MSALGKREQINKAISYFFDCNMKQSEACEMAGIGSTTLSNNLRKYHVCHCRECNEDHPCRAARRGTNGIMFCGALKETYDGPFCPFFKTWFDYDREFLETNRMTIGEMTRLGYFRKEDFI